MVSVVSHMYGGVISIGFTLQLHVGTYKCRFAIHETQQKSAVSAIYFFYQINLFWCFWACADRVFHALHVILYLRLQHIDITLWDEKQYWMNTPFLQRKAYFWKLYRPPESGSWRFHGPISFSWVLRRSPKPLLYTKNLSPKPSQGLSHKPSKYPGSLCTCRPVYWIE